MSDQVQLSAYSEAIQNLIHSERYDQAIALCQHILYHCPKHIATYRQMAEANLGKGDLQSAAELFRRVLSGDPEDYAAYAGLAVIFERQALIDEAVWHLERAFELNPSHPEIRNELLRLYGERDGRPQSRLRLTPGALARLYVREGLFAQAVQEFRAILSQAPRRLDARVALAETLWHAGQMRDSTQVCQEVLQALPHCLKANLILGMVMQESGAEEAETYFQSAQALDPSNRVAQEMFGEQSPLQASEVLVPQYVERSAPAPATEEAPAATEPAPAQTEGFEDWFAGERSESESEGFGEFKGFGESVGFGAPSQLTSEGMATTPSATPLEPWAAAEEQEAQEPASQEDWTSPSWVSQIIAPSEPAEFPSAESSAAETLSTAEISPTTEIPPVAVTPPAQPQPPTPQPELPPWLLSDLASPPATQPIVPSDNFLPPWLIEFQKVHRVDDTTESATRETEQAASSEPLSEWTVEPSETGEAPASPPAAKPGTVSSEPWPDWLLMPRPAAEEPSPSTEPTSLTEQLAAEQAVIAPEPVETGMPDEPAASEIRTAPAAEEETQFDLPDWLRTTQLQVSAAGMDTAPPSKDQANPPLPDWLKGLPEQIPLEPTHPAGEETGTQEAGRQEEQPLATAETRDEVEPAPETKPPLSQEEIAAQSGFDAASGLYSQEGESPQSSAWAIQAPEAPASAEPQGESEPIVLLEEAADRELYGDQTAAPLSEGLGAVEEPTARDAESAPPAAGAPAPVEANAPEELAPTESIRRRRDPKGYSHLVQARANCQDNRLGDALKEYDYLVQHSPRLVNAVIEDLEELVQRLDVPLEAHRILGDAYTRADRLADALERYRFVLERVS